MTGNPKGNPRSEGNISGNGTWGSNSSNRERVEARGEKAQKKGSRDSRGVRKKK